MLPLDYPSYSVWLDNDFFFMRNMKEKKVKFLENLSHFLVDCWLGLAWLAFRSESGCVIAIVLDWPGTYVSF